MCGADVVNDAVNAAVHAFPVWRDTPPVERGRLFFRYRQLVEENFVSTRWFGEDLGDVWKK